MFLSSYVVEGYSSESRKLFASENFYHYYVKKFSVLKIFSAPLVQRFSSFFFSYFFFGF